MTGHAEFWAAIGADPADPGPKLVYADWLEERGEAGAGAAVRACAAAGRWPRRHVYVTNGFFKAGEVGWQWWDAALCRADAILPDDIPRAVFRRLARADLIGSGHRSYRHLLAALLDYADALAPEPVGT